MKNEAKKNSFKEGLDTVKDHSVFMENDWSKMEQRLDQHANRKKVLLWSRILGGVAALLLLVLFWWLLQPNEVVQPTQETVKEKRSKEIEEPVNKTEKDLKTPEPIASDLSQQQQQAQQKQQVQLQEQPLQQAQKPYNFTDQDSYVDNAEILPRLDNRPIIDRLSRAVVPSLQVKPGIEKTVGIEETAKIKIKPGTVETTKIEQTTRPKLPKLALSLIYAPALNGVNNFGNAKVGSDVGILLTVGLSKKWSLTTGAIYAKKIYESDFSDYNPVNKDMLQYDPQSVFADCRVLDIPLNLNYTVLNKGKNTLSLGTGMSSYLMLKEDYRFNYAKNYNYPNSNYSITNQNQHWFGVLNFEAKFQRQISPKFAIGLQPYMKVPINDIGFANVKLQSLGMAINFNWNLNAFPKKDKK